MYSFSQVTLGGYHLKDWLISATHPAGCDPDYVTGKPNDSTWVNFYDGTDMIGMFGSSHVDTAGYDLLLETSYNRANYDVRLILSNGIGYTIMYHYVYEPDWIQIEDIPWKHRNSFCVAGTQNVQHFILPIDFAADFNLTTADTVTGIHIWFRTSEGWPDLAGVYIIKPTPPPTPIPVPEISMPNIFTPNNDGQNDQFFPVQMINVKDITLTIYNIWGTEIFETTNVPEGWDGKSNGQNSPEGTYYWRLNYSSLDDENYSKAGFLTLLR